MKVKPIYLKYLDWMALNLKGISASFTKSNPPPSSASAPRPLTTHVSDDPFASDNEISPLGVPPTLVIEATSDYEAKEVNQLSFREGEFFHVTDQLTDSEGRTWFQAENPATSVRGLVPSTHFRKYGPNRPTNLQPIRKKPNRPPSKPKLSQVIVKVSSQTKLALLKDKDAALASGESKPNRTPYHSLHGTVKYSFVAERADELSADRGEPIMVIAHGNLEWFVVKPIRRLGGPGLIPAAYVELQDIKTCRVLSSENIEELIRNSALPTVDEWKESVARYKASSISLGVIEGSRETVHQNDLIHSPSSRNEMGYTSTFPDNEDSCVADWRERQALFIQCAQEDTGLPLVEEEEEDDEEMKVQDRLRKRYGVLRNVNVTSFHYEQDQFWYQVHAYFQGSGQAQGRRALVLYRLESHFQTLESNLQLEFQNVLDVTLPTLSVSPTPTDGIACAQRMEELRNYLEEISEMSESIRTSEAVCEFLWQRRGDMEYEESEIDAPISPAESKQKREIPSLQLPASTAKPSSNTGIADLPVMSPRKEDLSLATPTDDIRSWVTSCEAASPFEYDFFREGPACSTQPSSVGSCLHSSPLEHGPTDSQNNSVSQSQRTKDSETSDYVRITLNKQSTNEAIVICVPLPLSLDDLLNHASRELSVTDDSHFKYRAETPKEKISTFTDNLESSDENCPNESFVALRNDAALNSWLVSGSRLVLYLD